MRRALLAMVAAAVALAGSAAPAEAHPLGNFTVNHYLGVAVRPDAVLIDYVVDMAEIPAFQERPAIEKDPAGACAALAPGIVVRVDGRAVALAGGTARLTFPPGQGGLDTLRLECAYSGALAGSAARHALTVSDNNHAERIGWREIVARGDGVALDTTLPSVSVSDRLTNYPQSLLSSPLNVRSGEARFATQPRDVMPLTLPALDSATGTILALLIALGLGALHAATPGHGKTVMAAYLVGTRRSLRDAAFLGLVVAVSHTAGVLALAAVVLIAGAALSPERAYPVLSAISALLVVGIGATMLAREVRHRLDHRHGHSHAHGAALGGGWRSLAALGLAGGIVPSASALVLLLGAIAARRPETGVLLIVAFGIGMAVTLVGAGLALVAATRSLERVHVSSRVLGALPTAAALVVTAVGLGLTAQSLAALL
jgi:ABC-type nickel/cobalt efflux system permease component RcnA